jgi:hypothetical protein
MNLSALLGFFSSQLFSAPFFSKEFFGDGGGIGWRPVHRETHD